MYRIQIAYPTAHCLHPVKAHLLQPMEFRRYLLPTLSMSLSSSVGLSSNTSILQILESTTRAFYKKRTTNTGMDTCRMVS